jgi:hypothetical protein
MPTSEFWYWAFIISFCMGLSWSIAREIHITFMKRQVYGMQEVLNKVADAIGGIENKLDSEAKELKTSFSEVRNMIFAVAMGGRSPHTSYYNTNADGGQVNQGGRVEGEQH